jgi:hypothetical protein
VFTTGGRFVNYADSEGRFLVRVPADGSWQLAVSDSGFATVRQQLSPASTEPVVLKLPFVGTQNVPDYERLRIYDCICPGELFLTRLRREPS